MFHFYTTEILIVLTTFLVNFFLFLKFKKLSAIFKLYSLPSNDETINTNIGYLLGGVILFINIIIFFILDFFFKINIFNELNNFELLIFFISFIFLFVLGVYDDKCNLSSYSKLFLLSLILYLLIFFDSSLQIKELRFQTFSIVINLGSFGNFFTILFFLLFLNAFNMFDGINLQSGLYSFLIISFFIVSVSLLKTFYFLLLIFLFLFLYWNYKKNVFLGNSGSLLLPFIVGYFFIKLYNNNTINFVEEIYIYMCIPGLDMFRLFLVRIADNKNPFKKDLRHIHHLLLKKEGYFKSVLLIQMLIFFTILTGYLISFQFAILASLFLYIYLLFKYI